MINSIPWCYISNYSHKTVNYLKEGPCVIQCVTLTINTNRGTQKTLRNGGVSCHPQQTRLLTHNADWCFQGLVNQITWGYLSARPLPGLTPDFLTQNLQNLWESVLNKAPVPLMTQKLWEIRDEWNSANHLLRVPRRPRKAEAWAEPLKFWVGRWLQVK